MLYVSMRGQIIYNIEQYQMCYHQLQRCHILLRQEKLTVLQLLALHLI